jgi:hypothetical protein
VKGMRTSKKSLAAIRQDRAVLAARRVARGKESRG